MNRIIIDKEEEIELTDEEQEIYEQGVCDGHSSAIKSFLIGACIGIAIGLLIVLFFKI